MRSATYYSEKADFCRHRKIVCSERLKVNNPDLPAPKGMAEAHRHFEEMEADYNRALSRASSNERDAA